MRRALLLLPLALVACGDVKEGVAIKLRDPAGVAVDVETPAGHTTILAAQGAPGEAPIPRSTPPRREGLLFPMSAIRNPDNSVTFRCDACTSHPSRVIVPATAMWEKGHFAREDVELGNGELRLHADYTYLVPSLPRASVQSAFRADLVTPASNILEIRYQPRDDRGDSGILFELGALTALLGVPMLIAGAKGEHGWYAGGIPLTAFSALSFAGFVYGMTRPPPPEQVLWPAR